jgi:osmotically-inducible protein OsmY
LIQRATHLRERPKPQPDDATLARKVETEIFRPAEVPKGKIDVNAEDGVVYLRGEADTPEMISELAGQARKVQGVRDVQSLLHLPGEPAPTKR